jgi:hypothetical protein
MERLTLGDLCVMGPGDLNKHGKEGKTSWDTTTYALVMAHNVYNHIQAIQEVNRLADLDYATRDPEEFLVSDWDQCRSKGVKLSKFLPNSIIYFNKFVEVLLDPLLPDPYTMLKEHDSFLKYVSFGDKKVVTEFDSIFGKIKEEKVLQEITAESLIDIDANLNLVMKAESKT